MAAQPTRVPFGVRFILGFHLVNIVLWLFGQSLAVTSYDTVAGWELQEPRTLVDPAIVEVNRGIALSDTLVMLPLFGTAFAGLLRMRFWGAAASWMAFGITVYWSSQFFYRETGITHAAVNAGTIVVPALFLGVASWASWYLLRIRGQFT